MRGTRREREEDANGTQPSKRRASHRVPAELTENAVEDEGGHRPAHIKGKRSVLAGNQSIGRDDGGDVDAAMDSVIKVFCTHTEFNFSLPWQRKRQYTSSSSGFVISGRRILTNAHSVDHHTQVRVKRRGSDKKYIATV